MSSPGPEHGRLGASSKTSSGSPGGFESIRGPPVGSILAESVGLTHDSMRRIMPPLATIGRLGEPHGNAAGLARAMAWYETADVEDVEFLASLPRIRSLDTIAGPALSCHGQGWDHFAWVGPDTPITKVSNEEGLRWTLARGFAFARCGHTRRGMVRRFDRLTVINAGAIGSDRNPEGFARVNFARGEVQDRFVDALRPHEHVRFEYVAVERLC